METKSRTESKPEDRGISRTDLAKALQGRTFAGSLIDPQHPSYEKKRGGYYSGPERRPALVVQAASAADVAQAVLLARETGLELAVRSGGHSVAGHSSTDGGILLDLGSLNGMEIDAAQRTAWAGPGLTAGEYTTAAAAHGLATGFGDTGSVGIGGITLGGGLGYLSRRYGLTIDHVLAADVVTADGQLVRADAQNHPDLFWALRGGGGNFGVVTRFQYRLNPVREITGGMLILPATADTIALFYEAAEAAPDTLSTIANIMTAPPMPFIPAELHGQMILMALLADCGPLENGEAVLAPFRAIAKPLSDQVRVMAYSDLFQGEGGDFHPMMTEQSRFMGPMDRSAAQALLDGLNASTAMMRVGQMRVLGGAIARVPVDATAFPHRQARVNISAAAIFTNPQERAAHLAWANDLTDRLRQGYPGAYLNFLVDDRPESVRDAFTAPTATPTAAAVGADTWARLRAVKARYDPTNLFRRNHNIPPAQVDSPAEKPNK
jgi:FAD/FMN-containing dehydrogenase